MRVKYKICLWFILEILNPELYTLNDILISASYLFSEEAPYGVNQQEAEMNEALEPNLTFQKNPKKKYKY